MRNFAGLSAVLLLSALTPVCALAHSYGPAPRVTGAPGDNARACTACHTGNNLNAGAGSVKIVLAGSAIYVPGVKQRITVEVADPASTQRRWGFELSARLNTDLEKNQAGDLLPIDNMTQVICEDGGPKPCATGPQFITHTSAGTRNGTLNGASFQFDWIPPATNAGPVTLYVAANAANGNGTNAGDFIYTASLELSPATPAAPAIAATGGIVSAATYQPGAVSPNSWVTIYGTNLSATTRPWHSTDFINGGLPSSLDGVSVLLVQNNAPRLAYVGYVSPTQINFLVPPDLSAAPASVVVRNTAGSSTAVPMPASADAGKLFTVDGKAVLGAHADGTLISKTAPAAPGETISLFCTGMGATSPALITGQIAPAGASVVNVPKVSINGASATVAAAVAVAGTAGVYQMNLQVPADAANGDAAVVVQVGAAGTTTATLPIQK